MKYYDGKPTMPDPYRGCSPMHLPDGTPNETLFVQLGGTITDDGKPTPEQAVCEEFSELVANLAKKTDKITPEEFLAAAQNGISSKLITFARDRGVSEEVIAEGRTRIVEIMADALRFGITWDTLIAGVTPK